MSRNGKASFDTSTSTLCIFVDSFVHGGCTGPSRSSQCIHVQYLYMYAYRYYTVWYCHGGGASQSIIVIVDAPVSIVLSQGMCHYCHHGGLSTLCRSGCAIHYSIFLSSVFSIQIVVLILIFIRFLSSPIYSFNDLLDMVT